MIVTAIILAILGSVNGDKVCSTNRFETIMQQLTATLMPGLPDPEIIDASVRLWYDYDHRRLRVESNQLDQSSGKRKLVTIMQYFEHNVQYFCIGGNCYHQSLMNASMLPACLPDGSVHTTEFTVGTGDQMLRVREYVGSRGGQDISFQLEYPSGVPISQSVHGTEGKTQILKQYIYGNYTLDAPDLVFNLPYECIKAQPVIGRRDLEVLEELQTIAALHPYINIQKD